MFSSRIPLFYSVSSNLRAPIRILYFPLFFSSHFVFFCIPYLHSRFLPLILASCVAVFMFIPFLSLVFCALSRLLTHIPSRFSLLTICPSRLILFGAFLVAK